MDGGVDGGPGTTTAARCLTAPQVPEIDQSLAVLHGSAVEVHAPDRHSHQTAAVVNVAGNQPDAAAARQAGLSSGRQEGVKQRTPRSAQASLWFAVAFATRQHHHERGIRPVDDRHLQRPVHPDLGLPGPAVSRGPGYSGSTHSTRPPAVRAGAPAKAIWKSATRLLSTLPSSSPSLLSRT